MDHVLIEFRKAATRENRGRRGLQRRYSPALQRRAVEYWRHQRAGGGSVPTVAAAVGVAPWSLHCWIHAAQVHRHFHPVQVLPPAPVRPVMSLSLRFTADGPRVEGLDIETVAKLPVLMR